MTAPTAETGSGGTGGTARAAHAARVRTWRHRAGRTRSTLVPLAPLGRFLAALPDEHLAAFVALIGEDVARRALWAARLDAPDMGRPVAR